MNLNDSDYSEYRTEWLRMMPYDYERVEQHLAEMAAKGWMLDVVGAFGWRYKKCEPADLKFSVTFLNSDNWRTLADEESVLDSYCRAAGWKKLVTWNRMQIYYTADSDAVPLETDEISRLENTWEAMKESYFPSVVMLFVVTVMNFFGQESWSIEKAILGFAVLNLVIMVLAYCLWRRKSIKNINEGGRCCSMRGINIYAKVIMIIAFVLMIGYCIATKSFGVAIIVFAVLGLCSMLTVRKKAQAGESVQKGEQ